MDVQNAEGLAAATERPSGNTNDNLSITDGQAACNLSVAQSEIPVVDVVLEQPIESETVRFATPCPYCSTARRPVFHRHGQPFAWLAPVGEIVGHRSPHCHTAAGQEAFKHGLYMRLVGIEPSATPSTVKKPTSRHNRRLDVVLSIEQAAKIVRSLAEGNACFALTEVVLDRSGYPRQDALCDSKSMTIAVPPHGVTLGSLVSELALLHVPGLGGPSIDYEKHRAAIARRVPALAKETQ